MRGGWLRSWEPAGVAVSLAVLALLTWQVSTGGGVVRLDEHVYGRVGVVGSPLVTVLSDLGSPEVSGVVLGVFALHHSFFSGRWWPIVLATGNGAMAAVVVLVLKAVTGRRGPGELPLEGYPGYFPSGHTATAAVCFGTATYIVGTSRRLHDASDAGVGAGLAVGIVVGAATVLSGNHWASDVAAGLAVAVLVLVLGFAVARRHLTREDLSEPRRRLMT
ncbi:MAG: phosphatase PAP2 family protein [Nocardioidaceae bacterium]